MLRAANRLVMPSALRHARHDRHRQGSLRLALFVDAQHHRFVRQIVVTANDIDGIHGQRLPSTRCAARFVAGWLLSVWGSPNGRPIHLGVARCDGTATRGRISKLPSDNEFHGR